jgi:hypothetical protein
LGEGTTASHAATRECVERLRNKVAVILVNAELLVEMTDGPAQERMAALLRNTEAAVAVLEELGHLIDETPRIGTRGKLHDT